MAATAVTSTGSAQSLCCGQTSLLRHKKHHAVITRLTTRAPGLCQSDLASQPLSISVILDRPVGEERELAFDFRLDQDIRSRVGRLPFALNCPRAVVCDEKARVTIP